ncbi:MAG TPA: patatin-like phospholipase family protein [Polyangiaceae bacterium]|jgi:predicted acylesterase/phospholipase RssA
MSDAVVLSGAVLKGPFGAGVLDTLTQEETIKALGLNVRRVVGASAGALSAAYYAAALHAGEEEGAGARLSKLWIDEATVFHSISPSLKAIFGGRGFSTARKLRQVMEKGIQPKPGRRHVSLGLVAANLRGSQTKIGNAPATIHEHVFWFHAADFSTPEGVEHLFDAISASAAFPGLFQPVDLRLHGRLASFVDGGAVNNTPIRQALGDPMDVERVFVISPTPRVERFSEQLSGIAYVSQLAEVLIEERLSRDLRDAAALNEGLLRLQETVPDAEAREKILEAIGWKGRRIVESIEIRPRRALPGTAFSGWIHKDLREEYVAEGRLAAERVVEHYVKHRRNGA